MIVIRSCCTHNGIKEIDMNNNGKITSMLAKISGAMGAACILVMTVLITVEIIARFVLKSSTLISDEYSGYLMVFVTYWGAAAAFHSGNFVRVEAIFSRFSLKVQDILNKIYEVLFLVFNSYICFYFFQSLEKVYTHNSLSISISRTPLWIPYGICWLGIFVFELYLISAFVDGIKDIRRNKK